MAGEELKVRKAERLKIVNAQNLAHGTHGIHRKRWFLVPSSG
jgi:hypothetical protein